MADDQHTQPMAHLRSDEFRLSARSLDLTLYEDDMLDLFIPTKTDSDDSQTTPWQGGDGWPVLKHARLYADSLIDLTLTENGYYNGREYSARDFTRQYPMPQLSALDLSIFSLLEWTPEGSCLNPLIHAFPWNQITQLGLMLRSSNFPAPWYQEPILLLPSFCRESLEICTLKFTRSSVSSNRNPILSAHLVNGTLTFPRLRELTIEVDHRWGYYPLHDEGGLDDDLSCLRLPALEKLTIHFDKHLQSCWCNRKNGLRGGLKISSLLALLSSSKNSLRELNLHGITFHNIESVRGYQKIPAVDLYTQILSQDIFTNLEVLRISDGFLNTFAFLKDKHKDATFLPALRHLELGASCTLCDSVLGCGKRDCLAVDMAHCEPKVADLQPDHVCSLMYEGFGCTCLVSSTHNVPPPPRTMQYYFDMMEISDEQYQQYLNEVSHS
ncbi:hypothetical protein DFP72DRAFT_844853 [Ephemerocybe angulata]|uniref:Uncharacterized protein n=1 Tax=Ephemerocybe angulata TaxID=980116 RepID=A0A8H6M862_9AGAR|nr:hypothetical protein DFP72DRAFT_844853 [Tulosesus angulatus]